MLRRPNRWNHEAAGGGGASDFGSSAMVRLRQNSAAVSRRSIGHRPLAGVESGGLRRARGLVVGLTVERVAEHVRPLFDHLQLRGGAPPIRPAGSGAQLVAAPL